MDPIIDTDDFSCPQVAICEAWHLSFSSLGVPKLPLTALGWAFMKLTPGPLANFFKGSYLIWRMCIVFPHNAFP